jgi:cytochrome c6
MQTGKLAHFITTLLFFSLTFSFTGGGQIAESAGKIDALKVYKNNCKKCHGADGKKTTRGKALGSPDFTDASWQDSISDSEVIEAITNGKNKMPSWKGELKPEEIMAVGRFIRFFAKRKRR